MLRHLAFAVAALCSVSSPAPAQQAETVKISFDVLFWAEWPEQTIRYLSGSQEKLVPLQNGLSGGLYLYEGPPVMVFYREKKIDPATGRDQPIALASVRFPKKSGHYILLFRNTGDPKAGYAVFPIPVSPSTFPLESVLAINFSASEAQIQVQGMGGALIPKASKFFKVDSGDFPIQLATRIGEEWQLAYSTVHSMQAKQRLLVAIHDLPGGDTGVAAFPIQDPASSEETLVDKDYKPDEMPEWMKTGVFR